MISSDYKAKATKGEIFAWCLYDFANSSYSTVIITVAFSIYFTTIIADGAGMGDGARLWGRTYAVSMLIIAVVSPLLGAIADDRGLKKRFLTAFTLLSVVATALLFFVGRGDITLGVILFTLSNIGFNGGMHFYNSFLIDISTKDNIGRISGYGWALGYVGGLIALVIVFPLIRGGLIEANLTSYRLSFPVTAAFFLICSIPTLLYLKERDGFHHRPRIGSTVRSAFGRIKTTFHEIKNFRELTKYFFAYLIYTDAVNTVIIFSSIFAHQVLGFTPAELIKYFIITQVAAAIGALVFGSIADKLGAKRSITITLVIWIGVIVGAYLVETKSGFYLIGLVAGTVLGANQSISRTLLGLFTPKGKNAEFFGFFALVGKLAAIIGPLVYGEISAYTGSQRIAILSLAAFFLVGLIILQTVDEEAGITASKSFSKEEN
ncbi:MAG: MFS transporter [Deltaproteobacteria bacterium]|nr:MFS transporter [Deltaproteobacteria bacterium]